MSLIRKLRDRLQGATLHDLWVETRWVLHHSKRYRRSIAAYVLLGIASIALSLLSSLSSRELINAIVYLQGGGRRVLFCGVTVVLLAGSTIVLNALVSRFSAKINLRIGNEPRRGLRHVPEHGLGIPAAVPLRRSAQPHQHGRLKCGGQRAWLDPLSCG